MIEKPYITDNQTNELYVSLSLLYKASAHIPLMLMHDGIGLHRFATTGDEPYLKVTEFLDWFIEQDLPAFNTCITTFKQILSEHTARIAH